MSSYSTKKILFAIENMKDSFSIFNKNSDVSFLIEMLQSQEKNSLKNSFATLLECSEKYIELICENIDKEIENEAKIVLADASIKSYLRGMVGFMIFYYFLIAFYQINFSKKKIIQLFESAVSGVIGYRILDMYADEQKNTQFIHLALYCIHIHEAKLLEVFGHNKTTFSIMERYKTEFLSAEIIEKSCKFVKSPYKAENIVSCGKKALHLFMPIALLLSKSVSKLPIKNDKITSEESYKNVYLYLASIVQIIDDMGDINTDIENGHYSYPTLWLDNSLLSSLNSENHTIIDKETTIILYFKCKNLLVETQIILEQFDDKAFQLFYELVRFKMNYVFMQKLKQFSS
jgi:hypothetical protein